MLEGDVRGKVTALRLSVFKMILFFRIILFLINVQPEKVPALVIACIFCGVTRLFNVPG